MKDYDNELVQPNGYLEDTHTQQFNGTWYHNQTPSKLVALLEAWRLEKKRLLFTYGDTKTGKVWEAATPYRGHIGRSTGDQPIPLLIRTKRSTGGEALLDKDILCVQESAGGKILYAAVSTDWILVVDPTTHKVLRAEVEPDPTCKALQNVVKR